jgi:hypothetical protein
MVIAKLNLFFLPLGLMTAYFSIQVPDLMGVYSGTTYWMCFLVISSLSFAAMFFFGRLGVYVSDKVSGWWEDVKRAHLQNRRRRQKKPLKEG